MSDSAPAGAGPATSNDRAVRVVGIVVAVLGAVFLVAGIVTYAVVSSTLADQNITVSDDAAHFAGKDVKGPFTAYAQADIINKHALEIGGGKTYAELPQDDPNRDTVMTASFLQASLFTSVVAFGVAAFVSVIGVVLMLLGWVLIRLARRPVVA
ncbi:aromatic ring-opening dioxygenase LigA [Nocardioides sp. Root1257]|uniref:hypothetical protein n=1 Tax=unclassified Nocardioides TaxID=2615069 RepID=UPI0006F9878D|nr:MULTISPECIES: hypothetical protein [unclassified Nocardioides]KQW48951.1 aromatic ring-opening dioxygenase LigA [Nocardioides sp. Root1257]KRC48125.1 aromatic ring-opening dioxygenase LigA [Nocardioides sp. Root224]